MFTSSREDRPNSVSCSGDLFGTSQDAAAVRELTSGPALDTDPTWSPDWTVILFASDRGNEDGSTDLWVIRADGSGVSRLWGRPGEEQEPTWLREPGRSSLKAGLASASLRMSGRDVGTHPTRT
jgi:Tol biopolymer transport system component